MPTTAAQISTVTPTAVQTGTVGPLVYALEERGGLTVHEARSGLHRIQLWFSRLTIAGVVLTAVTQGVLAVKAPHLAVNAFAWGMTYLFLAANAWHVELVARNRGYARLHFTNTSCTVHRWRDSEVLSRQTARSLELVPRGKNAVDVCAVSDAGVRRRVLWRLPRAQAEALVDLMHRWGEGSAHDGVAQLVAHGQRPGLPAVAAE